MPQDIHLDSFAPGWSFLTAQEHDQELILCNGFELVTIINSISGDRQAAANHVRDTMQRNGTTWSDAEWAETVEPVAVFAGSREEAGRCAPVASETGPCTQGLDFCGGFLHAACWRPGWSWLWARGSWREAALGE